MSTETMSLVLYLDVGMQRSHMKDWKEAIADVLLGKVEVIKYSRDLTIKGVGRTYRMPSVVKLVKSFNRNRRKVKFSRINVYRRDNFSCLYCGEQKKTEDLDFDHVIPRSQKGKTCWENIATSCKGCNRRKSNRTPEQANMRLLKQPKKPHYLPEMEMRMDVSRMPPEWKGYWSDALETT